MHNWKRGETVMLEDPDYHTHGGQRYVEVVDENGFGVALVLVDEGEESGEKNLKTILGAVPYTTLLELVERAIDNLEDRIYLGEKYGDYEPNDIKLMYRDVERFEALLS